MHMCDVARNAQQTNDLIMLVAVLAFDGLKSTAFSMDDRECLVNDGFVVRKYLHIIIRKPVVTF